MYVMKIGVKRNSTTIFWRELCRDLTRFPSFFLPESVISVIMKTAFILEHMCCCFGCAMAKPMVTSCKPLVTLEENGVRGNQADEGGSKSRQHQAGADVPDGSYGTGAW